MTADRLSCRLTAVSDNWCTCFPHDFQTGSRKIPFSLGQVAVAICSQDERSCSCYLLQTIGHLSTTSNYASATLRHSPENLYTVVGTCMLLAPVSGCLCWLCCLQVPNVLLSEAKGSAGGCSTISISRDGRWLAAACGDEKGMFKVHAGLLCDQVKAAGANVWHLCLKIYAYWSKHCESIT